MILYRCLFPVAFLVGLPFYARRMIKRGGYGKRLADRFGFPPRPAFDRPGPVIWFQAVSVGEVLAIDPVLRELRRRRPDANLLLTTTTSTGFRLAREKAAEADYLAYFPLDFWPLSARVWRLFRPSLCVLMEGELWPEHLHQARRRGAPVLLVNARLSDRSFRRYRLAGPLARPLLRPLRRILAASDEDAERFRSLAPAGPPVGTAGNLKFDVDLPPKPEGEDRARSLRATGLAASGEPAPLVLLGSSTWPGEEELLADVVSELRAGGTPTKLVIVPRHAERGDEIAALLGRRGLPFSRRSTDGPADPANPIYLADTTGELREFTALADLAFVGKSLPPNEGGQTPIEAGGYGVPVVYGPRMSNFKAACQGLETAGAALRCADADEVRTTLLRLARDPVERARLSRHGREWHAANRGAVDRTVDFILAETGTAPGA